MSHSCDKSMMVRRAWLMLPPIALFALVLIVWQSLIVALQIKPYQLPRPMSVALAAWNNAGTLAQATAITALGAVGGFVASLVIGAFVAVIFSQSRMIASSAYPYAIFLQTVPIVAVAPIIINWFGAGFVSVVVVAFIISLFPIITNMYVGLTRIDGSLLELFRLHNATRWQTLVKLRVPSAVPNLVTGAKVSSGLSVIGAIVGEFFAGFGAASHGLGYVIPQASGQLKMDYLFAAVFCSALLGLAVFGTVSVVGATILRRWDTLGRPQILTEPRNF
jgi:NitT/TauT family transport system permease protein